MLKPFIFPFRTRGAYYFYDVNTDRIVSVEKKIYQYLCSQQRGEEIIEDEEVMKKVKVLERQGFLKTNRVEVIRHPDTDIIESILNKNMNHLIIQVTQGCNLRCAYCAYSNHYENRKHNKKRMDWRMAKEAIDFLIRHSACSDSITLGFYGGEPLLEFELIKKCMEYITEEAEGKEVRFVMTTNATLLTGEMIEFFEKYNFTLMISLDGPEEVHDRNRRFANDTGSFETVIANLRNIKEKFPEFFKKIKYNMVLDLQNDLQMICDFIKESDIVDKTAANISTLSNLYVKEEFIKPSEEMTISLKMELLKVYLKKLGKISEDEVCLFDADYTDIESKLVYNSNHRVELPLKAHPGGPCTPGRKRIFMNIEGDFYPCERVSEYSKMMKLGNLYEGFDVEQVKKLLNVGRITEHECKECWAFSYCTQCAAFADELDKLSKEKRLSCCKDTKAKVANMFLNYCMLKELGYTFNTKTDMNLEEVLI